MQREGAVDYYRDTEKRLYSYPLLKKHCETLEDDIASIEADDPRSRSKSIVLLCSRSNADREEMMDVLLENKRALLQKNRAEVAEIESALDFLKAENFVEVIDLKYFRNIPDEQAAEELNCDRSTIWRRRKELVRKLSVIFYGVDATRRR